MTTNKDSDEPFVLLSDRHGINIPKLFAACFEIKHGCIKDDCLEILQAGPEHDEYWDAWDEVLSDAVLVNHEGKEYTLYQDGDLWAVPKGMEWSEDDDWFIWPDSKIAEEDRQREADDNSQFGVGG